jgi:hypothetical protein
MQIVAKKTTHIALSDLTPNRGTVLYVGTDEAAAREACDANGGDTRVLREHPDSAETPTVGARAYHDHEYAWTACGYSASERDTETGPEGGFPGRPEDA